MICDEDPLRRRPRESTARRKRQERCVWMARKMTEWPSQARADYQNHAIGWLHRGYSSLGGGKVVRFPRIWMVYGECRSRRSPPPPFQSKSIEQGNERHVGQRKRTWHLRALRGRPGTRRLSGLRACRRQQPSRLSERRRARDHGRGGRRHHPLPPQHARRASFPRRWPTRPPASSSPARTGSRSSTTGRSTPRRRRTCWTTM